VRNIYYVRYSYILYYVQRWYVFITRLAKGTTACNVVHSSFPDLKTDVQPTFNTIWSLCTLFCLHNLFKLSIMGLKETPLCGSKHNEQTSHPHCSSYIRSVQFSGNLFQKRDVGIRVYTYMRLWSTIKVIYVMRSKYYHACGIYHQYTADTYTMYWTRLNGDYIYSSCSVVRISTLLI